MTSSIDTFHHKFAASQQQLHELLQWAEDPQVQARMPSHMLEEMSTALEELHVAAEVMQEQSEKLAESQHTLDAERQYFQELFDLAPDGYLVTDEYATIRRANQAAAEMFHTDPKYLDGKPLIVLIYPEDRMTFRKWIETVSRRGGRAEWEGRLLNRAGGSFPALLSVAVNLTLNGHVDHYRWLLRDLTERKRLEAELRDRAEQLERMNRAKDDFLAMLGHELRNPLVPLRNIAPILMKDPSPNRLDWALGVLRRQVNNLTRLVDDLLDASRLSRGKIQVRREPLDLTALMRTTIEDQRAALEETRLTLTLELPDQPVLVLGDATRLAQVLDNLLHNASKFTPSGGRVTVRLAVDENQRAVATVCDTGQGIVPELLPNVFEIFTQGKGNLGGLGLGLAMVKGLVELHGGEVTVASEGIGRGATFTFWLPLCAQNPALPPPPPVGAVRPFRVLVIEDEADVADSLCRGLALYGHTVEAAASGAAGIEAAHRTRPDVVLCDLGMAEMDGFAVAAHLRRELDNGHLPLIAYSGYGHEEAQRRAVAAGFDLHLTKPLDLAQLQEAIADLLARLKP